MVAYGSSLKSARRHGWEDAYLNYDLLQSLLDEAAKMRQHRDALLKSQEFFAALDAEIEKISLFTLKRQGELADMLGALRFAERGRRPSRRHLHYQEKDKDASAMSTDYEEEQEEEEEEVSVFDSQRQQLTVKRYDSYNNADDPILYSYCEVGVELLHLLRFICVNATGIRKVLKKHDKMISKRQAVRGSFSEHWDMTTTTLSMMPHQSKLQEDSHLNQLANSASISALTDSLASSSSSSGNAIHNGTTKTEYLRFQCVMEAVQNLRQSAEIVVNRPFEIFLAGKARIITFAKDNNEHVFNKLLQELLNFKPSAILRMTRTDLLEWRQDQLLRTTPAATATPKAKTKKQHRHARTFSFPKVQQPDGLQAWGGVNSISLAINLLSTLLYTVNYYIIAPTANHYAMALGTDGAFGATLVGASSFSALFAAFLYSFWFSTQSSFRSCLVFSAVCPLIGNLIYSLAISYHSMSIAIFGRILCGFGSAEVVNRQLISACVSFPSMTRASALFVGAGAIGMSIGPLLAAILDLTSGRDGAVHIVVPFDCPAGGIIFNHTTSPGFVMAGLWFVQLLLLFFLFQEPEQINGSGGAPVVETDDAWSDDELVETDMLTTYGTVRSSSSSLRSPSSSLRSPSSSLRRKENRGTPALELSETLRLIAGNTPLLVTMCLFGYVELVDEVLITSCSMVSKRYFGWEGSTAGFLIACLGALVLPADFVVERASRVYNERRIMKYSIVFIFISLIAIINFEGLLYDVAGILNEVLDPHVVHKERDVTIGGTPAKYLISKSGCEFPYDWAAGPIVYVASLSAVFMGTIILEGVDTSLMNKATPAELNGTFLNSGLLATLIGTLGRVLADSMLTLSALLDIHIFVDFVNATFGPLLVLTLIGYLMVQINYNKLM